MVHLSQSRQRRERWPISLGVVAALLVLLPAMSVAQAHPWEKLVVNICPPMGVPRALALAVIDIESKANPLAVNMVINGKEKGFLPQNPTHAHTVLADALKETPIVGVGLMQITYRYHQEAMATDPHRFFDPATNLDYGCAYLGRLLQQSGPLWKRLGRYHSAKNLSRQEEYTRRVLKRMRRYLGP